MKDHIASSCSISRDDFDYAELADKGGLQKAWGCLARSWMADG
jgi:type I restriction enzyme R subunit